MGNHVHVLVRLPKPPEAMPDDAELVRLVRRADLSYPASELERQLAEMRNVDLRGLFAVRDLPRSHKGQAFYAENPLTREWSWATG